MVKAKQKWKGVVCKGGMSTSHKVFLHAEGEEDDIRRFIACKSFVCVQKKLKDGYPELKDETFDVTWKDNVSDMVTIANADDLILALTEMSLQPYNIHVMKCVVMSKRPSRRSALEQVIQERDVLRRDLDRARDDNNRDKEDLHHIINTQETLIENIVSSLKKSRRARSVGILSEDLNNTLSMLGLGTPVTRTSSQTDQGVYKILHAKFIFFRHRRYGDVKGGRAQIYITKNSNQP